MFTRNSVRFTSATWPALLAWVLWCLDCCNRFLKLETRCHQARWCWKWKMRVWPPERWKRALLGKRDLETVRASKLSRSEIERTCLDCYIHLQEPDAWRNKKSHQKQIYDSHLEPNCSLTYQWWTFGRPEFESSFGWGRPQGSWSFEGLASSCQMTNGQKSLKSRPNIF